MKPIKQDNKTAFQKPQEKWVIAEPDSDNIMRYRESDYGKGVRFETKALADTYIRTMPNIHTLIRVNLKAKKESELL